MLLGYINPIFRRRVLRKVSAAVSGRTSASLKYPSRRISSIRISRAVTPLPHNFNQKESHPVVKKGELYNGCYETLRNIGCGRYSTVWSVRDRRTEEELVMKVLVSSLTDNKLGPDEAGVMTILRNGNPKSPGKNHVCQLLDSFIHSGPTGRHLCLILEPLGLSIHDIYRSFSLSLPLILVQRIANHVLQGLQYIHECGVIHTDIKADNIMMTGTGFPAEQSTMELEIAELFSNRYKLTDFGSANTMSRQWAAVIQPLALRSPEVLIDAPWDTKVDIWNFGCLMYEFARGAALFDPTWQNNETGMDTTQTHLAQIAGLLGEFPVEFLKQGKKTPDYFDTNGKLLCPGKYNITLSDLLVRGGHPPEDLPPFIDFLSHTLTINPQARWSASQLLKHPWMQNTIDF
ncbi:kinase-like protein [Panus rudis PR-1116 ss-1]|nr:kinase-like protein [Panus rudis PR-1116 ss-1]